MPFNRRSIERFSSSMALSKLGAAAEPVVTPSPVFGRPDDWAVPALLVPGGESCGEVVPEVPGDDGPPVPPPVPWAKPAAGASRIAIVASAAVTDNLRIGILPCGLNHSARRRFRQHWSNAVCAS